MVYENFNRALTDLINISRTAIERNGKIDFTHLYKEDEYGCIDDNRPSIIIADRHCEIAWYKVNSAWYDEDRNDIMVDCDDIGEVPLTYAEGFSEISLYYAIN